MARVPKLSGNVWSRYMTIESVVERGTLAVERSPMLRISGSPDELKVGPHLYSGKPPVLSVLAAGLYLPMFAAGLTFTRSAAQFALVNWVLVATIVGFCSGLALVGLRKLLQVADVSPLAADLLTLAFGFSSLLMTYGVTFNNHSVAAGLATYALALVALEDPAGKLGRVRFVAGLLAGLAAVIDIPGTGTLIAALGVWLAVRARAVAWSFVAGASGPLLAHAAIQTLVTGSPWPAESTPSLFEYQGSYWVSEAGKWKEAGPRWLFGLEMLFGPQGWLSVTPALAFGLAGLAWIAARRGDPLQPLALVVSSAIAAPLVYFTWFVWRTDFAGQSFGTRHLLAIAPACYCFAVVLLGRLRSRLASALFGLCLVVGTVYSLAGARDPWSRIERRNDMGLAVVKRFALYPWSSYRR
jgi:hypothetical protein